LGYTANIYNRHYERTDVRLLQSVGENLAQCIRDRSNILEHMTKDGMLDDVYEEGFGLDFVNEYIAQMTAQIAHRYPRMNILEIGETARPMSFMTPRYCDILTIV
jgi:hybrid polyketide synthase/nonribosomal peptide synthetase ACE1